MEDYADPSSLWQASVSAIFYRADLSRRSFNEDGSYLSEGGRAAPRRDAATSRSYRQSLKVEGFQSIVFTDCWVFMGHRFSQINNVVLHY